MGFIQDSDVARLMQNQELMAEVAQAIASDPSTMDDLAEDIASKLEDELEDSEALSGQIVDAAISSDEFKKKVVEKLAAEMS